MYTSVVSIFFYGRHNTYDIRGMRHGMDNNELAHIEINEKHLFDNKEQQEKWCLLIKKLYAIVMNVLLDTAL